MKKFFGTREKKNNKEVRAIQNGENAVTPSKNDKFGGTKDHRVRTNDEDITLNFQLKTRRSTGVQGPLRVTGLCIVTTGNSTAAQLCIVISPHFLKRNISGHAAT